jgi:hypothetical protein
MSANPTQQKKDPIGALKIADDWSLSFYHGT